MDIYHDIWLEKHPERTREWLMERLRDGFDIHHLDGDHSNNDPRNLILVETLDHNIDIHGHAFVRLFGPPKDDTPEEIAFQEQLYLDRIDGIHTEARWNDIGRPYGLDGIKASEAAKKAALRRGWRWPIKY